MLYRDGATLLDDQIEADERFSRAEDLSMDYPQNRDYVAAKIARHEEAVMMDDLSCLTEPVHIYGCRL